MVIYPNIGDSNSLTQIRWLRTISLTISHRYGNDNILKYILEAVVNPFHDHNNSCKIVE